jgi:NAD(P)-dependent dehydrogenase (short-subunit alcohol dehydrogenase family)
MAAPRSSPPAPRRALVLGASSPIGARLSDALEARSWIVQRHRRAPGDEAAHPKRDSWIYADLSEAEAIAGLAKRVEAQAPELLVFCASRFWSSSAEDLDVAKAQEAFTIKALAPLLIGEAQLRGADRAGRLATQVHLMDRAGGEPFLRAAGYSLGRAAADNAFRQLVRRSPIEAAVVGLELGIVSIPGRARPAEVAIAARDTIAGRPASLEEVQALFLSILERPAAFHGARLRLDGGLALRAPLMEPVE